MNLNKHNILALVGKINKEGIRSNLNTLKKTLSSKKQTSSDKVKLPNLDQM
jgi:hypothetical protein